MHFDPTQSFFTLGQPTGISEPSGGCDLSGSPAAVSCIYEVRVAEDAVNIDKLENAAAEFAYIFRTRVTDQAGNTSNAAVSGYVQVTGEGETPTPPGDGGNNQSCMNPVNVPDAVLERDLRDALSKPDGSLTCEDLASLTEFLSAPSEPEDAVVASFEGLQFATNLKVLSLGGNRSEGKSADIGPLQNLTKLTFLYLNDFEISDISPLQNLTNLTELSLGGNDLSDLSTL